MPLAKQLSKQLSERSEKIKADKQKKNVKFRDNSNLVENISQTTKVGAPHYDPASSNNKTISQNKVHATNLSINLNELAGMSSSTNDTTIENDDSLILPNLSNVSNLDGTEFGRSGQKKSGQSQLNSTSKYSTRNNNLNHNNNNSSDEYDGYHNNEHLETVTPKSRSKRNTRSIGL